MAIQKWEPKKLNPRHRIILYKYMQGARTTDIAEEMGLTIPSVSRIIHSKPFQEALKKANDKAEDVVKDRIANASHLAIELLEDIILSEEVDVKLRAQTAENMLDRAGHKSQTNTVVQTNIINLIERAYDEKTIDITPEKS